MKQITRAQLRGKQLHDFCHRANRSINECGPNDNRVFCYGFMDSRTDELIKKCRNCKAHVNCAEPTSLIESDKQQLDHESADLGKGE